MGYIAKFAIIHQLGVRKRFLAIGRCRNLLPGGLAVELRLHVWVLGGSAVQGLPMPSARWRGCTAQFEWNDIMQLELHAPYQEIQVLINDYLVENQGKQAGNPT